MTWVLRCQNEARPCLGRSSLRHKPFPIGGAKKDRSQTNARNRLGRISHAGTGTPRTQGQALRIWHPEFHGPLRVQTTSAETRRRLKVTTTVAEQRSSCWNLQYSGDSNLTRPHELASSSLTLNSCGLLFVRFLSFRFAMIPKKMSKEGLLSLDAFRGLIMLSLVCGGFGLQSAANTHLKINPDSNFWQFIHYHSRHTEWTGCSAWDVIIPCFMFMVGMGMAYSSTRRTQEGAPD